MKTVGFESFNSAPDDSPQAQLVLQFVRCLVAGDFHAAHRSLSADLQATLSPSKLREHYASITCYWDCDVEVVRLLGVSNVRTPPRVPEMFGWIVPPDPEPDTGERDVGISIESDPEGLVEFIQVRVAPEDKRLVICEIMWGRP